MKTKVDEYKDIRVFSRDEMEFMSNFDEYRRFTRLADRYIRYKSKGIIRKMSFITDWGTGIKLSYDLSAIALHNTELLVMYKLPHDFDVQFGVIRNVQTRRDEGVADCSYTFNGIHAERLGLTGRVYESDWFRLASLYRSFLLGYFILSPRWFPKDSVRNRGFYTEEHGSIDELELKLDLAAPENEAEAERTPFG